MSDAIRSAVLTELRSLRKGSTINARTLCRRTGLSPGDLNAYLLLGSQIDEIDVRDGDIRLTDRMWGLMSKPKPKPNPAPFLKSGRPWENSAAIICGMVWLTAILVYAMFRESPIADRNFILIRSVLAIAAAAFGAAIPGFINIELTTGKSFVLRAVGAAAFFVIVYYFLPKI